MIKRSQVHEIVPEMSAAVCWRQIASPAGEARRTAERGVETIEWTRAWQKDTVESTYAPRIQHSGSLGRQHNPETQQVRRPRMLNVCAHPVCAGARVAGSTCDREWSSAGRSTLARTTGHPAASTSFRRL